MKILKYIAFALLGIILIFLLIGLFIKKIEYSNEVIVDKPLEESWAVSQDESKMKDWLDGFKTIELKKGNKGEVGSEYDVIFEQEGEELVIHEILRGLEENESMKADYINDFMNMHYKMNFDEMNGKTKISTNSIVKGNGIIMRALMPLSKSTFVAQEDANLSRLKKVIESNSTNYFPAEVDASMAQ